jgi:HEAT repeat protein
VSRFLRSPNLDVQVEAASALAQCRAPAAITALRDFWDDGLPPAIDVRRAILIGLGASPLRESADFLLAAIAAEPPTLAETAITALSTSRYRAEYQAAAAEAVTSRGLPALQRLFDAKFRS